MEVNITPIHCGPGRPKRQRKGQFALCLSWVSLHLLLSDIGTPGSNFRLRRGVTPLAPLVLSPLGLDWNNSTSFPKPPTCREQVMGLLSLHNHVSQSFIINLSIYLCLYLFYFSGEPSLIQSIMSVGGA